MNNTTSSQNYIYIQSERAGQKISEGNYMEHNLYTVGFYSPDGKWNPESDYSDPEKAAERVRCLNGGPDEAVIKLRAQRDELQRTLLEVEKERDASDHAIVELAHKLEQSQDEVKALSQVIADLLEVSEQSQKREAELSETLEKAADTLADASTAFRLFGKTTAASAMQIAENAVRAAIKEKRGRDDEND